MVFSVYFFRRVILGFFDRVCVVVGKIRTRLWRLGCCGGGFFGLWEFVFKLLCEVVSYVLLLSVFWWDRSCFFDVSLAFGFSGLTVGVRFFVGYLNVFFNNRWRERWCRVKDNKLVFYKDRVDLKIYIVFILFRGCEVISGLDFKYFLTFRLFRYG